MRIACVWRRESDYGRELEEWIREFEQRTGVEVENINPDSREGVSFCQALGVVEYPTILALGDDGQMMAMWRGRQLPLLDEVAYYLR